MTPKEKARELVLKYYVNIPLNCLMLDENLSKKMALIAVDEILEAINGMVDEEIGYSADDYYLKVKQEIELL